MEEEFQVGVCGGNWWNSSRIFFGSSPCSAAVNDSGWLNPSHIVDMKIAKSISDDSAGSASASDGGSSVVLQEPPQPHLTSNRNMPIDSTLHMMADDWNQDFLHDSARSQENYSHMLQSLNSSMNCRQKIAEDQWTTDENFIVQQQQPPNSFSTSTQSAATCDGLPATSFPLDTASYGYTNSSLLQTLFDSDSQPLLETEATNYSSSSQNFRMNSIVPNNFQFINNTTFWNATAAASSGDVRPSFLPSSTPQLIPSALTKPKLNQKNFGSKNFNGKAGEADYETKKGGNEPAFKRPRIETPSPLPTFKVRKEKLGDRVTALQQLVSPFGKTDTASVLHEAIDYIKLLHDQVTVLSTPYLKSCTPPLHRQQAPDKIKNQEEATKDLRSRGLCLVPISSTFPVATETTADFWTPTFGASFR